MEKQLKIRFVEILRKQTEVYKKLKPVMSDESSALSTNDVKALEGLMFKEETLILDIKKLEDEKMEVFMKMAAGEGFKKDEPVTLSDVLARIDRADAEEIEKETSLLVQCVKEIDTLNVKNTALIKNFLGLIDFTKQLKNKIENPVNVTYTSSGNKDEYKMPAKSSGLDIKL